MKNESFRAGAAEYLAKLAKIEHKALTSFLRGGGKVSPAMKKNLGVSRGAMLRAKFGIGATRAADAAKAKVTGVGSSVKKQVGTVVERLGGKTPKPVTKPNPGGFKGGFSNFPSDWKVKSSLPKAPQMKGRESAASAKGFFAGKAKPAPAKRGSAADMF